MDLKETPERRDEKKDNFKKAIHQWGSLIIRSLLRGRKQVICLTVLCPNCPDLMASSQRKRQLSNSYQGFFTQNWSPFLHCEINRRPIIGQGVSSQCCCTTNMFELCPVQLGREVPDFVSLLSAQQPPPDSESWKFLPYLHEHILCTTEPLYKNNSNWT